MKDIFPLRLDKRLMRPIEVAFWIGIISVPVLAYFVPIQPGHWQTLIAVSIFTAIFMLIYFHYIVPRYATRRWAQYLGSGVAIIAITAYTHILGPYGIHGELLYLVVIAGTGISNGRKIAVHITWGAVALTILVHLPAAAFGQAGLIVLAMQLLIILISGYSISSLTGAIHARLVKANTQNRYLSMLLQTGTIASRPEVLESLLSKTAEMITRDVPVTSCRIMLLDQSGEHLVTYGAFPIRRLEGWNPALQQTWQIACFPAFSTTLDSGKTLVVQEKGLQAFLDENPGVYADNVKTICLIPLIAHETRLGLITIGEIRRWEREPFTQEKLSLLQTLAAQISSSIFTTRLYQETKRQAERLSVLNQVAKAIGSTIELDDLLELIYDQLSRVIPTDTYFVSLYDAEQNTLEIRILIDDGQRFPSKILMMGSGFASQVILTRQPFHVRHLSQEMNNLPVKPIQMGQERMSESWLGVPMLTGDRPVGLLTVASYIPNAFNEDDVSLISSLAAQGALALDNARQHAAVKEQTRRDSLTNALNHGALVEKLFEEVERAQAQQAQITLIMLDVDLFKQYNDTYGHAAGDEVLKQVTHTIQSQLRKEDFLGRWGGEEFSIGLPGMNSEQATALARQIQTGLAQIVLTTRKSAPLPNPTISQGIATFPDHAHNSDELIDIADAALYRAKAQGRNQIVRHDSALR